MKVITGMEEDVFARSDQRLSHLVAGWLLLIPLFYFASQGDLWFNSKSPVEAASYANALASAGSRTEDHVIILTVFSIVLVLIGSRIKSVLILCRRGKEFVALAGLALGSCLWSQLPR